MFGGGVNDMRGFKTKCIPSKKYKQWIFFMSFFCSPKNQKTKIEKNQREKKSYGAIKNNIDSNKSLKWNKIK